MNCIIKDGSAAGFGSVYIEDIRRLCWALSSFWASI
jgi:hypothetical protein